ncbi:MAG: RNA 2',3'-cyclic phosphodiesterase [Candidatus Omnitrophota bacterium]
MGIRTFIAIEIPEILCAEFAQLQEELKKAEADIKWVEPKNMHLTLKFLGDTEETKITKIKESLQKISQKANSFEINFRGLGAFPNLESPRVLWIGIEKGKDKLFELATKIEDELKILGFPKEKRQFSAHLTLGRIRSFKNREKLKTTIKEKVNFKARNKMYLKEIVLFKSQLTPSGPIYTCLAKFNLPSTPGVE